MKIIAIITLVVSTLILIHCENIPMIGNKKKKVSAVDRYWKNVFPYCFSMTSWSYYNGIEDNNDGTISLVNYSSFSSPLCPWSIGKPPTVTKKIQYYIKKCIQGQVYRQAQNDCKGTGTADNYYGAQKFQACPTNDTACDDSAGNQSKTLSPARASCINDTTAGVSWDNDSRELSPSNYKTSNYFLVRNDEIPTNDTDRYWRYNFGAFDYKLEIRGIGTNSKNLFFYVMCFHKA